MPNEETRALAFLESKPVFYMDMIEPIRRGKADILDVAEDGVLLRELGSGALMMTAASEETARHFLGRKEEAQLFVAHQRFYVEDARMRYGLHRVMACYQAAWLQDGAMPVPQASFSVRALDSAHIERVMALYSHAASRDYIAGRIAAGELYGAFDADVLAGFAGLHEEGSLGMLEVDPAYRRRQVASTLTAFLVNMLLERGRTPYSQFVEANKASRQMQEKMGMTVSEHLLYWLEV